jgi:hypothetical protein
MHPISFRDTVFSTADANQYDLSVFCSPDGISFLVIQSGSVLLCEHYPFNMAGHQMVLRKIRDLAASHELFGQPFRKTTIHFGDRQISLVPETIWSEKPTEFIHGSEKKQDTETESVVVSLHQMGACLVFRTGKELFDYLNLVFPGAGITHEVVPLLQHLQSNRDTGIHFHMHSFWFYAILFQEGKLEFINSFQYKNETDMLYYMLSVVREFRSTHQPVFISGWIEPEDSRFILIKKHIPEVVLEGCINENILSDKGLASQYFNYLLH